MTIGYSPSIPNPPNDPGDDVATMQSNATAIGNIIAIDHVGFNVSGSGQHAQVTFNANNVPSVPTSPPVLFTNTVAGLPQLFFYSGNSGHSSSQYVAAATGSTLLLGGIIIKWGSVVSATNGGTYTFVNAFPNNCYNVQVTLNIASSVTPIGINGFTTTGFTFRSTVGGGVPITFFAIGN